MKSKNSKKQIKIKHKGKGKIIGLLLALTVMGQLPTQTVLATNYDANRPVTWNQMSAPYSNQSFAYCGEGMFGPCSCGVHSLATLLLKTEYWERGKTAVDAYQFSQEHKIGSNYQGIPSYHWPGVTKATNKNVTHIRSHWPQNSTTSHDIIREEYEKGNFMLLSVEVGGGGHLIAVDYVDEDGNIVIIDSAINAKYLTQMDNNGYVRDIQVFESDTIKATEAAKFWEGEEVGKVKRERELQELKQELADLQKLKEEEEQAKQEKEVILKGIQSHSQKKETNIHIPEVIKQVLGEELMGKQVEESHSKIGDDTLFATIKQ